jgi:uncharacterized membrane protein
VAAQRDEQGAVAVFTAVALVAVLVMAAFAVDLGMHRVLRRDLQALADAVASDLAHEVDGRTAAAILADPGWAAARADSVARNDSGLGSAPAVTAEVGTVDSSYAFTAASGTTVPTAVRVVASGDVDYAFASGSGAASRSAVTVTRAQACYKLGSWGARLDSASSALLATVLAGHGVAVGAATYQSLVGAEVDAVELAAALDLASPEQLGTATVSLGTLLDAAAEVLGSSGATDAQVSALDAVRTGAGSLGNEPVALATLFSVASGAGAGLVAAVDLADLVVGSILVADGNSAATVDLGSGLPGVGSLSSSVGLIQAARTACGFAGATPNRSNQVVMTSSASLTNSSLSLGLPFIASVTVGSGTPMSLSVTTASATSALDATSCAGTGPSATVSTTGGLLSASLVLPVRVKGTVLGIAHTLDLTFRSTLTPSGTPGAVTITVPPQDYQTPYSNGGSPPQLPTATLDPVGTVGWLSTSQLNDLVAVVTANVVTPVVTALNANVLAPLSDLAGVRTAGADVLLLDHPTCSTPALRG